MTGGCEGGRGACGDAAGRVEAGTGGRCGRAGALRAGSGGKGCRGPVGARFPVVGAPIGRAGTDTLRLATPGACGWEGDASGGCKALPACIGGRSGKNGFGFSDSAGAGVPGEGGATGSDGADGGTAGLAARSGVRTGSRTGTRMGGCNPGVRAWPGGTDGDGDAAGA